MASESLDFWYDAQIKRMLLQVTRIFGNFQVATGYNPDGTYNLRKVPSRMAIRNRQVAHILKNNSENIMLSVPQITINLDSVSYRRDSVQEPFHVDKVQIWERDYDEETQEYGTKVGATYTLERIMAIPYELTFTVDFWVSNMDQKAQLFEQVAVLFNPSLQLQFTENVFDWTALTEITLTDVTWSNRSIPIGTSEEIEIMSMRFTTPVWISPPAYLQKQKVIHTIVNNILQTNDFIKENLGKGYEMVWDDEDLLGRVITTPGNHSIFVEGNIIKLLGPGNEEIGPNKLPYSWKELIDLYGPFRPGLSMIGLNPTNDIENQTQIIKGTIDFGSEPNELVWTPNIMSLPTNTLLPIKGIIDPHATWPGHGLPVVSTGDRYLLLDEVGTNQAWGNIFAKVNDIIEYDGTKWNTVFVAENEKLNIYYILNSFNNKQLKWTGTEWQYAIEGLYEEGFWRLYL